MLLVGLGNPGKEYQGTRHNIGFDIVDALMAHYQFSEFRKKFKGEFSEGQIGDAKIFALKPTTFMNLSGTSVQEAARFYKIPLNDIVVIHDELDLPVGKLRVKIGGGNGGHNGIDSIDTHIGKDYRRVRVGIDHPGDKDKVHSYVLNKFRKEEREVIDKLINAVVDAFPLLVAGDDPEFMNKVSLAIQPPKQPSKNTEEAP